MRVLFLHPNFPAQFRDLAPALAADPANDVVFLTQEAERHLAGVRKVRFGPLRDFHEKTHQYVRPAERAVLLGQGAYRAARQLQAEGFEPDLVIGHSGWGQTLFVKDAFPQSRYLAYIDWYYHPHGANADFFPGEEPDLEASCRMRLRNAPILLDLDACDWGVVTTRWQLRQVPELFRSKLSLLHDGIRTEQFVPAPGTRFANPSVDLRHVEELVTFATRSLDPYRGFPTFMRAVELLLRRRPHAHVAIAGDDRTPYGWGPPGGGTWRETLLREVDVDPARVHFLGLLPNDEMLRLLQASAAHVYFSAPFIPSWSMFEAMSAGCLLVGSSTPPVEELVVDGHNGLLVDFFDHAALADRLEEALRDPARFTEVRAAARRTVVERYDLSLILPRQLQLLDDLLADRVPAERTAAVVADPEARAVPPPPRVPAPPLLPDRAPVAPSTPVTATTPEVTR